MSEWHGYVAIQRISANLGQSNWNALVALVNQIAGVQYSGIVLPQYAVVQRVSLDGNTVIYEGNFALSDRSFAAFQNKLANAFGVNLGLISYMTAAQTISAHPTVFATYAYATINRFRVGWFGCPMSQHYVRGRKAWSNVQPILSKTRVNGKPTARAAALTLSLFVHHR